MLRFHGSKDKVDFHFVGCNSRLDEIQATALRLFLPELDGWNRGRREAAERYRELGLGEHIDTPMDEPGHVYHLFVSRSPERDAIVAALKEQQIGCATYYVTPPPPPAGAALPRIRGGVAPGDRARRARELLDPALAGHPARDPGARGRGSKERGCGENHVVIPSTASRLAALCRRGARRRSLVPRLPAPLRQGRPGLLRDAVRADDSDRHRDQARRLHPLRHLQPLVALRLDAGHVADRSRRHRRVPRRRPDRLPHQSGRPRPAAARDRRHGLAPDSASWSPARACSSARSWSVRRRAGSSRAARKSSSSARVTPRSSSSARC